MPDFFSPHQGTQAQPPALLWECNTTFYHLSSEGRCFTCSTVKYCAEQVCPKSGLGANHGPKSDFIWPFVSTLKSFTYGLHHKQNQQSVISLSPPAASTVRCNQWVDKSFTHSHNSKSGLNEPEILIFSSFTEAWALCYFTLNIFLTKLQNDN